MRMQSTWLGAAVIITIVFGTTYTVVQQAQRRDANYPQIQMAQDTATDLNNGVPIDLSMGVIGRNIDMAKSLSIFTDIYDLSGNPVAGNGMLNGKLPAVPIGVLTAARNKDYNFVSWQPETNVRIAAVTTTANKYYVLSGRSLKEVEKNENASFQLSVFGWALSMIVFVLIYRAKRVV